MKARVGTQSRILHGRHTKNRDVSASVCLSLDSLARALNSHTDCKRKRLLSSASNLRCVLFVVVLYCMDKTVISFKHQELVTLGRQNVTVTLCVIEVTSLPCPVCVCVCLCACLCVCL